MSFEKVTNIKNIRRENWPYIMIWIVYYAWVIVFTTWWTASPLTDQVYGTNIRNALQAINLLSSAAFVFIIKKEWFIYTSRIGAAALVVTSVLFMVLRQPQLQLINIIFLGISLGCVNSGILMPFVFVLNNTEKFYAVVCSNFLICILTFLQELNLLNITNGFYFSFAMLLLSLSAVLFFRKGCMEAAAPRKPAPIPKTHRILYITVIINCLYAILCKGVGRAFLTLADTQTTQQLRPIYYIGGMAGCLIYVFIYFFFKKSIHVTWNLTFGTFVVAMLIYAFSGENSGLLAFFAFLVGIGGTIGMINMYYILGVIGKKYDSLMYVRISILFIGICGGVSGVALGNLLTSSNAELLSVTIAIWSSVIVMVLLIISPALASSYFKEEWAQDSQKHEIDNEHLQRFAKYKLSEREIQLCKLLLDGYTLRQAAAYMGVAYSTANTYCNSIYRKMKINSRLELISVLKEND